MTIADIDRPTVAIVVFAKERRNAEAADQMGMPSPRLVHYQVTIKPEAISPSGCYIRFGDAGDEIIGWQPIDAIEVIEVLAEESNGQFLKTSLLAA